VVELKGTLGAIGLPEIVQLIGELRHSGNLELRKNDSRLVLGFDEGRLVSADSGQARGLAALGVYARELAHAEFRFVEGVLPGERSPDLDLGHAELQRLLAGMANGKAAEPSVEHTAPALNDRSAAATVCPSLGFADDPSRHYSRPTALHRCFASPTPSLVTNHEQLDLCLGGAFSTCPRFLGASSSKPAASLQDAPPPNQAASELRPADIAAEHPTMTDRRWPLRVIGGAAAAMLVVVGIAWALVISAVNRPQQPIPSNLETQPAAPVTIATAVPRPTTPPSRIPTSTTAARLATPTAAPRPPAVAGVRSLVDARFTSGPADNWLTNPPYAAWSDGAYRLQARDLAQFVAVGVPMSQDLSDGVVSATLRKTGGPPGGGYGLILRDQGPLPRDGINQEANAYVFAAGDLGEFGVWRRDGDHWVDLVPWTRSDAVRAGGSPNDLTVRALGVRLTLTINGVRVAVVEDDALASGGVGIFVGGDYNEVALDHFSVQLPD
jgi:hypothetical protein